MQNQVFANDGMVDAAPYLNNRNLVTASGQPYNQKLNPRQVTNPDNYGTPNTLDRAYWKSKNRVNAPVNPKVPQAQDRAYWRSKRVVNNEEQDEEDQKEVPKAVAPWGAPRSKVTADGAPFGKGHGNINSNPQAISRLREQRKNAKASGQPFNVKGLTPEQNLQDEKVTPSNEDRAYWRSKNRVNNEVQSERILVNGVMTEVKFVNELPEERFEVEGVQGIQSAINARNQELAKLNALREQQADVEDKRTALLNKVNRQGFQAKVKASDQKNKPSRSFTPKNQ